MKTPIEIIIIIINNNKLLYGYIFDENVVNIVLFLNIIKFKVIIIANINAGKINELLSFFIVFFM